MRLLARLLGRGGLVACLAAALGLLEGVNVAAADLLAHGRDVEEPVRGLAGLLGLLLGLLQLVEGGGVGGMIKSVGVADGGLHARGSPGGLGGVDLRLLGGLEGLPVLPDGVITWRSGGGSTRRGGRCCRRTGSALAADGDLGDR